jgi:FkbM family methyltransferase
MVKPELTKEMASHRTICLPNGLSVQGLTKDDTLMIYKDIFEDDCYRLHGVTIKDGDCIVDVGANTGLFLLFLNQICKRARVYAFEPLPAIFRVLQLNARARNKLDAKLFNTGLSNRAGKATFTYYPRMSNASTMYPDDSEEAKARARTYIVEQFKTLPLPLALFLGLLPDLLRRRLAERVRRFYLKKQAVTCELTTLSAVFQEQHIASVDLLKIDAEQSEEDILAGIGALDWPKIRQMIVEVHHGEGATQAIVRQLNGHGFRTTIGSNPAFPTLYLIYAVREDIGDTQKARSGVSRHVQVAASGVASVPPA